MNMINEHFYFTNDGRMQNNCDKGCCMHCKYLLDAKNKEWLACSESCLTSKAMVGKSCTKCNHSEYGRL